jgi:hypothetical protein
LAAERALFGLHALALVLALAAALLWPRPGQPVLLVPLGGSGGLATALDWAEAAGADYLAIDPARARVIVRLPADASLASAPMAGILPLAIRFDSCMRPDTGRT